MSVCGKYFVCLMIGLLPIQTACASPKAEFRDIYDVNCFDLFVNPLYITRDPTNTLIYKPTVVHCLMVAALKASLEKEKDPKRKEEIYTAFVKMKKMKDLFLGAYKFALPGIQYSDTIKQSQQMRVENIKKQKLKG